MNLSMKPLALSLLMVLSASSQADIVDTLDAQLFDPDVAACTDFYQHANGGWIERNPLPAAYSSWGVFNELGERQLPLLRSLLEKAGAHSKDQDATQRKLGDFYAAAMDESFIEKAGIKPIKPELKKIANIKTRADLTRYLIAGEADGTGALFGLRVQADLKDTNINIAYAGQGGLGLPERDYYTRDDDASKKLRAQYLAFIKRMLTLSGSKDDVAAHDAQHVLDLETRLANASMTRLELRKPQNGYRIVDIKQANELTPNFDWHEMFAAIGHDKLDRFSQAQPDFFAEMDKALVDTPIPVWQAYLRWHLVRQSAPYLSADFVNADFAFNGTTLNGTSELRPRWKRVIDNTNMAMGEALGQPFVAEVFPPEAKDQALILVKNLQAALKHRIEQLDWMSEETRSKALEKFATFTPKIGYPDQWRDYTNLKIKPDDYVGNIRAAIAFETARRFAQIGQPVDRREWGMLPQTVNASYSPVRNEISFPAAILQAPFFDPKADAALNYGAIGAVIGHELMHGYDDQGSQFDAQGNLNMWWTKEDRANFEARTAKLVAQFDEFVAIEGKHVNGKLTLGENIADLGGLLVAYDAFKMATQDQQLPNIGGLTPDQRFFHAWARGWRRLHTDENLKLRLNTDVHAPAKFRVLGPFANLSIFSDAFGCKPGDAMIRNAEQRVEIW